MKEFCWRCGIEVVPVTTSKRAPIDDLPGARIIEFVRYTCPRCGGQIGDSPPRLVAAEEDCGIQAS